MEKEGIILFLCKKCSLLGFHCVKFTIEAEADITQVFRDRGRFAMRAAIISPCPKQFDDQHLPSFHPRLLG